MSFGGLKKKTEGPTPLNNRPTDNIVVEGGVWGCPPHKSIMDWFVSWYFLAVICPCIYHRDTLILLVGNYKEYLEVRIGVLDDDFRSVQNSVVLCYCQCNSLGWYLQKYSNGSPLAKLHHIYAINLWACCSCEWATNRLYTLDWAVAWARLGYAIG